MSKKHKRSRSTHKAPVSLPKSPSEPRVNKARFTVRYGLAFKFGMVCLLAAFAWAFWPTLVALADTWEREPDYSHGYFVVPIAAYFLWARRASFPGFDGSGRWFGLVLLGGFFAARCVGSLFYIDAIDGWSIILWASAAAWLLGGWQLFRWCLPAIAFLLFMVPLPFRAERLLSLPLQHLATGMSCWLLQTLGQPAFAEGTTILLGDQHLEIERACSGLRMFVGISALAFVYCVLARRPWWEKLILVASVAPVSMAANAIRITTTGLLYQYASSEAAQKFSHDIAGWLMIPMAAVLFAALAWYLRKVIVEVQVDDAHKLIASTYDLQAGS